MEQHWSSQRTWRRAAWLRTRGTGCVYTCTQYNHILSETLICFAMHCVRSEGDGVNLRERVMGEREWLGETITLMCLLASNAGTGSKHFILRFGATHRECVLDTSSPFGNLRGALDRLFWPPSISVALARAVR